jgi:hypothetical protein
MTDLFRKSLNGVSARGGYCLDCLSEIYGEPAKAVTGYVSAMANLRPPSHMRQLRRGPGDLPLRSAFLARQSSARAAHHFPLAA